MEAEAAGELAALLLHVLYLGSILVVLIHAGPALAAAFLNVPRAAPRRKIAFFDGVNDSDSEGEEERSADDVLVAKKAV